MNTEIIFRYFYLYKLSYLYSVAIGFLVTYIVGYAVSRILSAFNLSGIDKVHIDGDKNLVNFDLFFPPVAKSLRKSHTKRDLLLQPKNEVLGVNKP